MPEIPSPDRMAVGIRQPENAAKEGTILANTVRLLVDHGTKESRVTSSNHFKQPNDSRKPRLITTASRRRLDQPRDTRMTLPRSMVTLGPMTERSMVTPSSMSTG